MAFSLFHLNKYIGISLGIGATSPLIALVISNRTISLYSICIILVCFLLLYKLPYRKFKILKTSLSIYYIIWLIFCVLSCIFGYFYFLNENVAYSFATLTRIPKICFYLFLFFLFPNYKYFILLGKFILCGIYIGILLNLIWSVMDAIGYYIFHISITNIFFHSYIQAEGMPHGMASIIDGLSIRSVGLNNDPATIGLFCIITSVFSFLRKKYRLLLLSILASLSSISFIGFVGILIVTIYFLLYNYRNKIKTLFITISVILLSFYILNYTSNVYLDTLKYVIEQKGEKKLDSGSHSTQTRLLFIEKAPNVFVHNPIVIIIGTGLSTAVYNYYKEGLYYGGEEYPTEMENTYIDLFFAIGLIGFSFFLLLYITIYYKYKLILKKESTFNTKIIYSISFAILIAYFFYHYSLYSVIMWFSIISIVFEPIYRKSILRRKLIRKL